MFSSQLVAISLGALMVSPLSVASPVGVVGQKLDSGLGALPHYSQWADKSGRTVNATRVAGESLDNGLGNLPHYSQWLDKTGRDPMRAPEVARMAGTR